MDEDSTETERERISIWGEANGLFCVPLGLARSALVNLISSDLVKDRRTSMCKTLELPARNQNLLTFSSVGYGCNSYQFGPTVSVFQQ
jgi:hypothetical protein